ncbi:Lrp/AsnC family transcriptional regulator [Gordonia sp. DT30]|uniref:Lrp/AsnC family transcriptional regulator n=1 Tax=Gordonia sp. DT30 TaxID=3416546 RepID=UPI003CF8A425
MSHPLPSTSPRRMTESLDPVDQAIVALLCEDGRVPVARIAERINISAATARQRLDRLLASRDIRVVGLVDPALLGTPVMAYLVVDTDARTSSVAGELAHIAEAQWIATVTDLVTVLVQVSTKDNASLVKLIDERIRPVAGVNTVRVQHVLRSFITPYAFGSSASGTAEPTAWVEGAGRGIDDADRLILGVLQSDGRATFTDLAHTCGLSVPATRQRFLRLSSRSLVRIHCRIAPSLLGMHAIGTIRILCRANSTRVASRLTQLPEAVWMAQTAGQYDMNLEVICRDREHLAGVYRQVRDMDEVAESVLLPHQDVVKQTSRWSH